MDKKCCHAPKDLIEMGGESKCCPRCDGSRYGNAPQNVCGNCCATNPQDIPTYLGYSMGKRCCASNSSLQYDRFSDGKMKHMHYASTCCASNRPPKTLPAYSGSYVGTYCCSEAQQAMLGYSETWVEALSSWNGYEYADTYYTSVAFSPYCQ